MYWAIVALEHTRHDLRNTFGDRIDLDVDRVAHTFVREDNKLLAMLDEHDSEFTLLVVDFSQGQGSAIKRNIAFGQ